MEELIERRKRFIINFAYVSICLALFYVFFKYVFYIAFPFVLALIITLLLKGPIDFISKKTRIPRKGTSLIVLGIFYAFVAFVLFGIVFGIVVYSIKWIGELPQLYVKDIQPAVERIVIWFENLWPELSTEYASYLQAVGDKLIGTLYSLVQIISGRAVTIAQALALGVPKTLIASIFAIVSTVFMTLDWPDISYFILAQFGDRGKVIIRDSQKYLGRTILDIIKSYACIMFVTFIELCIGLTILGVDRAPFYALLIAFFDIIPALGTGGIVIPWAIIQMIYRNWRMAIGLLVLYAIITVVRNTIEPKIVGSSIGVHPVLMLLSMYLGAYIFGAIGIIVLPFSLVVVKNLNDTGKIDLFNSDYLTKKETK